MKAIDGIRCLLQSFSLAMIVLLIMRYYELTYGPEIIGSWFN